MTSPAEYQDTASRLDDSPSTFPEHEHEHEHGMVEPATNIRGVKGQKYT